MQDLDYLVILCYAMRFEGIQKNPKSMGWLIATVTRKRMSSWWRALTWRGLVHKVTVAYPMGPPSTILILRRCWRGCIDRWRHNTVSWLMKFPTVFKYRLFEWLIRTSSTKCWWDRTLEGFTLGLLDRVKVLSASHYGLALLWLAGQWQIMCIRRVEAYCNFSFHIQQGSTWCGKFPRVLRSLDWVGRAGQFKGKWIKGDLIVMAGQVSEH